MSHKKSRQVSTPTPGRAPVPTLPIPRALPVEPSEVLGRHKNTGQRDHKGAR
jgi:hypothetical protein